MGIGDKALISHLVVSGLSRFERSFEKGKWDNIPLELISKR